MTDDERAIRRLVATWLQATAAGDLPRVLELMSDDVVFLVAGQPPLRGRAAFAAGLQSLLENFRVESTSDIQEIQVAGDWAYCWNCLSVVVIPRLGGVEVRRSGHTLSVLRKQANGSWVLVRDANLLTTATTPE